MSSYGSFDERSPLLEDGLQTEKPTVQISKKRNTVKKTCMSPNGPGTRILALFLMSLVGFGAFFCFDNPGALQKEVKKDLHLTTTQFASLYSWYSWPNVVLPVIGGYLIDKVFGVRLGTILFAGFILLGQLVLSTGGFMEELWLMDIGRFVFGVGGESLNMALNTYTVQWFRGKELNLVFGLQLSISRVGSTVNFLVMEPLYELLNEGNSNHIIGLSLLIAASFTFLSFFSSVLLGALDYRREKSLATEDNEKESEPEVNIKDIFKLPASFWLLCVCTMAYYGSIFPFVSLAQGFFTTRFELTASEANFITGLVYLVSAIASPVFGFLLDKTGKNVSWMMFALAASGVSHILLCGLDPSFSPYPAIILLGLAYSILASALWSLPALLVQPHQLGTAFGLMQALQNLGTALITLAAGAIVDKLDYVWMEIFFTFWIGIALLCAGTIWLIDYFNKGDLNLSTKMRDLIEKESAIGYEDGLNNNRVDNYETL